MAAPSTPADVVDRAVAFYRAMGKRPQVLAKEIPGFVANRLQAALFREAVYLVEQGIVSEQQLDDVVTSSIGMRWAVGGPFQSFHLGGGPGGLADFIQHLGPALEALWKTLGTAAFDEATVATLTAQAANFGGSVESSLHGATTPSCGCCGRSTRCRRQHEHRLTRGSYQRRS